MDAEKVMNQHEVSKMIVKYLLGKFNANMYHSSTLPAKTGYTVRYSHSEIKENDWPPNEDIGLYMNKKEVREGNSAQVAVPDVALIKENDKEVKIIIEVESSDNFKEMLHSIGPIALADVYSPSYKYNSKATSYRPNYSSDGNDYSIKKIILFILVLGEDREQFREMRQRLIQISSKNESSDNEPSKRITVFFESGNNPDALVQKFIYRLKTNNIQ